MSHFLQSEAWARVQRALGRESVEDAGDGWRYRAYLERGRMNSRLYCPYGPEVDSPEALVAAVDSLKRHGKRLGAAFLRIEPTGSTTAQQLESLGFVKAARKQPEHTQRIDVDRPFDAVLAEMSASQRNLHRNYAKKGLTVRQSHDAADVEHLVRLLGEVSDRTGEMMHEGDYLRMQARELMPTNDASMYLVELEGEVIAASLIYDDAERRYYAHAAANTEHRKLSPGVVLVSQMIADAAEGPQREFDLYGVVPPEQTEHSWSGFSKFKRSFGGQQYDFLGTWELTLKPFSMALYRLAQRVVK